MAVMANIQDDSMIVDQRWPPNVPSIQTGILSFLSFVMFG